MEKQSEFSTITAEIDVLKKNIYYNIFDKDKKSVKILALDISGGQPVAKYIYAEGINLLTCLGKPKIHHTYLHYLSKK